MSDVVNHPKHYTSHQSGVECIAVTERLGFCAGNAIKYLWRADLKGRQSEDIKKAMWYLDRIIDAEDRACHLHGLDDRVLQHYEVRLADAGGWNAPAICNILRGVTTNSVSHLVVARNQLDYLINHPTAPRTSPSIPCNA